MELELGLALPKSDQMMRKLHLNHDTTHNSKKRRFEEEHPGAVTTLPLFASNNHQLQAPHPLNNGQRVLVGWPPIKCMRGDCSGSGRTSKWVKVKREGLLIGRKVDLSLHCSYHDLFQTLNEMFPDQNDVTMGESGAEAEHHDHTVTYEDGEGDWMLVGDVPWEAFIHSVRRMKILC